jgi:hypothetical protein
MADAIKVGIWGGSASGKTTYLAALRIAALQYPEGRWVIQGMDEKHPYSSKFLSDNTQSLLSGSFPEPTLDANAETYSYQVNGHLVSNSAWWKKKLYEILRLQREVRFILEIYDYPGGVLLRRDPNEKLWEYLADCQGLIYLFDPHQTAVGTSNFDYLQHSLDMIRHVLVRRHGKAMESGRLPQHLALCITKFDDDIIFRRLLNQKLIARARNDKRLTPFVTDPMKAVRCLADDLTVATIEGYFEEERVNFFATSSIGFYVDRNTSVIDIERCSNTRKKQVKMMVKDEKTGQPVERITEQDVIAGEIYPVNVFEPLLWLHLKLMNNK